MSHRGSDDPPTLFDAMIEKLESEFPSLQFGVDREKRRLSIPSQWDEVGGIEIQDEGHELTVYEEESTHWHADCYEEGLSQAEKVAYIVDSVATFLRDLLEGRIVMWGSHDGAGGFYYRDETTEDGASGEEGPDDEPRGSTSAKPTRSS